MKQIPLTQGKFAIVDDQDFEWLNQWKWCFGNGGYAFRADRSNGKAKCVYMHREVHNTPDGLFTDHINGNGIDNRRDNLRSCSTSQNNKNQKRNSKNTSGYKGVSMIKKTGRWRAQIKNEGKKMYVGSFKTPEDAHEAYKEVASALHGDFARFE